MELTIFATYEEANAALELPRAPKPAIYVKGVGMAGEQAGIPALDKDVNAEQYSCVVYVRKWSYDGNTGSPDLSFIGLECVEHLKDGYKTDIFIYARIDGCDSQN